MDDDEPFPKNAVDLTQESRRYGDIQLPSVTGKVTPFQESRHPSKLNKRSRPCTVGEGVEIEVELSRQRRCFKATSDVGNHLTAIKRKQLLLRQNSNPQEVPGSPVLLPSQSSSSTFRDEAGVDLISFHESPPEEAKSSAITDSVTMRKINTSRGNNFSSPVCQPLYPVSYYSELDPDLHHLLGGTVSPAVASTPSPRIIPGSTSISRSHVAVAVPVTPLNRLIGEGVFVSGDGQAIEPATSANFDAPLDVRHDERDNLSELPILDSFGQHQETHTTPSFTFVLPNDLPPPSLSLLHSRTFNSANQSIYPSQDTSLISRLPGQNARARESFNAATFSISRYHPREE